MVKRSTWIVLAVLALVIGAYFLVKNRPEKSEELTPTPTASSFLVTEADGTLINLRIFDGRNVFQMQRNEINLWEVVLPSAGIADIGLASAAETQVGALRIVDRFETPPALSEMGLESPAYTIRLGFASGVEHKIDIGPMTPSQRGYYVEYDDKDIYVVSQAGIDSLLNLLISPPYPPTPTPTLEPTATTEFTTTPALETDTPTP